jgi:hypothetical protein
MDLEETKSDEDVKQKLEFLRWVWDLRDGVKVYINEAKHEKVISHLRKYSVEAYGNEIEAGKLNSVIGEVIYLLRGRQSLFETQEIKSILGTKVKKDCSIKVKNPITLELIDKIDDRFFGGASYRMNNPKTRNTWMWTDASTEGVGGLIKIAPLRRKWIYFEYPHKVDYTKIIENESLAALIGLKILCQLKRRNVEINVDNPTTRAVLLGKNPKVKVVNVDELRKEVSKVGITWTTNLQDKSNEELEMKVADLLSRRRREEALKLLRDREESLLEIGEIKSFKIERGMWSIKTLLENEISGEKFRLEDFGDGESSTSEEKQTSRQNILAQKHF